MANQYSVSPSNTVQGVSVDSSRRIFNFGDRVAELAPMESPFFAYLSQLSKAPTDDPVFKFLEQRHQWQRRNFIVSTDKLDQNLQTTPTFDIVLGATVDNYGRDLGKDANGFQVTGTADFFLANQRIVLQGSVGSATTATPEYLVYATINSVGSDSGDGTTVNITVTHVSDITGTSGYTDTLTGLTAVDFYQKTASVEGYKGQIIGSAFGEGSTAPDGWVDQLYDREGYTQIFKTAVPLFSGTALATRYRGRPDEYMRIWNQKLKEHKIDIEHALMFGVGRADESGSGPARYTHGIVPYTEKYGYNKAFTYASSSYDDFVDFTEEFFAPEIGNSPNKLVLASRKVMNYFQKLGGDGFLANSFGVMGTGSAPTALKFDIQSGQGRFGHNITKIETMYGSLNFVMEPLLRGPFENMAIAVDMANVKYRPLVGNGENRDTQIITNVQNNDVDGRKDMVLTEAGLEISLPETHALLKFS
jgi:hypothetical protein